MTKEEIETAITESGATITDFRFQTVKACVVELDGKHHVGISCTLDQRERKACLAHELGHIKKGGLYQIHTPPLLKKKAESIADRYAAEILASPEDIQNAIKSGCTESWQLADHFDIPYEVMDRIIESYKLRSVI